MSWTQKISQLGKTLSQEFVPQKKNKTGVDSNSGNGGEDPPTTLDDSNQNEPEPSNSPDDPIIVSKGENNNQDKKDENKENFKKLEYDISPDILDEYEEIEGESEEDEESDFFGKSTIEIPGKKKIEDDTSQLKQEDDAQIEKLIKELKKLNNKFLFDGSMSCPEIYTHLINNDSKEGPSIFFTDLGEVELSSVKNELQADTFVTFKRVFSKFKGSQIEKEYFLLIDDYFGVNYVFKIDYIENKTILSELCCNEDTISEAIDKLEQIFSISFTKLKSKDKSNDIVKQEQRVNTSVLQLPANTIEISSNELKKETVESKLEEVKKDVEDPIEIPIEAPKEEVQEKIFSSEPPSLEDLKRTI